MSAHTLASLLQPRSIAVLGASAREGSTGNRAVLNLINFGFTGAIYPISPSAPEIHGRRGYPDLKGLPEIPDCVAVAIPAEKTVTALEEAAALGIKSAVIFASGFGEAGPDGVAREYALKDLARRTGLLVCGPNCLGLANVGARVSLYTSILPPDLPTGGAAIVSHSGSVCILLSNLGRFGISYIVAAGNSAVLDMGDYLDFLAADEATRVAVLFIETIRDPRKFAAAAGKMRAAGKSIVALKAGRSEKGSAATAAHTGSLAGSDAVYQEFFRQHGVITVDDLDELVESAVLMLSHQRRPRGKGLGVINVSGGEIALTCDIAQRVGLELPELAPATVARLRATLPSFGNPANPLDATGVAVGDTALYGACIEALASDPAIAMVAVSQDCPAGMSARQAGRYRTLSAKAAEMAGRIDKPVVFFSNVAGGIHPDVLAPLQAAGVPALQGAKASLLAIKRLFEHVAQVDTPRGNPDHAAPADPGWRDRLRSGTAFTEREAKAFLAAHGIAAPREMLVQTADEAVTALSQLSAPVVLKIESPDIPHKSDIGGVKLGLRTPADVRAACAEIVQNARTLSPQARLNGVVVQEMVEGGIEVIVGLTRQDPFGLTLTVGAGGVLVELVRDSALALLPVTRERALHLIGQTRAAALLRGYRGGPAADIDALADLLVALSTIGTRYGDLIDALELNPVSVQRAGAGLRVLDALLIPRSTAAN